jgi:hypothetical protein
MSDLFSLIWHAVIGLFRSRAALQAEVLILRHQLNVLRRKSPKRVVLGNIDRAVLIGLYRLAPTVLETLKIINPEMLIRWLSFPKIMSARSNDAAQTESAQRQWFHIAGPLDRAEHPCPTIDAFASHCNSRNTRSGSAADAVRRR